MAHYSNHYDAHKFVADTMLHLRSMPMSDSPTRHMIEALTRSPAAAAAVTVPTASPGTPSYDRGQCPPYENESVDSSVCRRMWKDFDDEAAQMSQVRIQSATRLVVHPAEVPVLRAPTRAVEPPQPVVYPVKREPLVDTTSSAALYVPSSPRSPTQRKPVSRRARPVPQEMEVDVKTEVPVTDGGASRTRPPPFEEGSVTGSASAQPWSDWRENENDTTARQPVASVIPTTASGGGGAAIGSCTYFYIGGSFDSVQVSLKKRKYGFYQDSTTSA